MVIFSKNCRNCPTTVGLAPKPPSTLFAWIVAVCSTCCPIATFFKQKHSNFCFKPPSFLLQNPSCAHGCSCKQRWSPRGRPWPRGHILKSLALASKVKSLALASRPQVLENWPVLGSRTAVFFELLIFWGALEKFFGKRFFVEIAWKIFVKTFFFFWRALVLVSLVLGLGLEHSCPWPRECLSSERLSLALASDFFLSLASSFVSSTPPLVARFYLTL